MGAGVGWVAWMVLAGCGSEYGLQQVEPHTPTPSATVEGAGAVRASADAAAEVVVIEPDAEPTPRWRPVRAPLERGAAVEAHEDPELGLRQEIFDLGGGARTPVSDFLFVVDGSVSMEQVIGQVQAGFEGLAREGVFPERARIAVTGTIPATSHLRPRVHPAVASKRLAAIDPGFSGLVDEERLRVARQVDEWADAFALPGCDPWFAPTAVAADGTPCLVSHTQTAAVFYRVEAGLTVTAQMLLRGDLFRPGAAANVIIVSDTHDPGANPERSGVDELVAGRPTGEQLASMARSAHVASFRLHAVAPASDCGERWHGGGDDIGFAYFDAAEETGGETLDLCNAGPEDYRRLIRAVVENGSVPTAPIVPLGRPADEVTAVRVDGEPVSWTTFADGEVVRLPGALPSSRSRVEVEFRPRGASRPSSETSRPSPPPPTPVRGAPTGIPQRPAPTAPGTRR